MPDGSHRGWSFRKSCARMRHAPFNRVEVVGPMNRGSGFEPGSLFLLCIRISLRALWLAIYKKTRRLACVPSLFHRTRTKSVKNSSNPHILFGFAGAGVYSTAELKRTQGV